jgi:hypothetical protein
MKEQQIQKKNEATEKEVVIYAVYTTQSEIKASVLMENSVLVW